MEKANWKFEIIETSDPDDYKVRDFINGNLSDKQRLTYKVAQDDRRSEKAHAVIFFDEAATTYVPSGQKVSYKEFKAKGTSKSDLEEACKDAIKWLNTELKVIQSTNARMTLSNSKNPKEILSFYYPNLG